MNATLELDGIPVITQLEIAGTVPERMRGLLGREGLAAGQGFYIPTCGSVHTFGMRFAIDLIFVDRDWRVRRVVRNVGPHRAVWGGWGAAGVIEVASGWLTVPALVPGALLRLCQAPGSTPAVPVAGAGGRP